MAAQQPVSLARNRALVGREIDVLVEARPSGGAVAVGRSWRDAPEIDGTVRVEGFSGNAAAPGDWVRVRVTAAKPYDLVGVPVSGGSS
jgi:ribosomal protein S12 methylthiotransferase